MYTSANTTYKAAPPNITLILYKKFTRPYILYSGPIIIQSSGKEIKILEKIERRLIRPHHNKTRLRDYLTETTKRYWTLANNRPTLD